MCGLNTPMKLLEFTRISLKAVYLKGYLAPPAGLEPATSGLTVHLDRYKYLILLIKIFVYGFVVDLCIYQNHLIQFYLAPWVSLKFGRVFQYFRIPMTDSDQGRLYCISDTPRDVWVHQILCS